MQRRRKSRSTPLAVGLIWLASGLVAVGGLVFGWIRYHSQKPPNERYAITDVRRATLYPTLVASGRVESAKRTLIRCELENVAVGVRGQRLAAGGASTLIRVIPDGTLVQRGDVLAVLDSSDYEELVRVQRITVERAKADRLQAQLDHEIAKLAVLEFREGTMQETLEDYKGRITLARADLERANDRMNWSRSMKQKGYVSMSTVRSDEFAAARTEETLKQEESAFDLFRKFTAPRTLRELEGAVLGTQATLNYQQLRAQRHIARLAMLEKQVNACTIRAPHDGFVIHANDNRRQVYIEEGMPVHQKQPLFYLPDLNEMEIVAQLHESIVSEVRPGMEVTVEVETFPDREMEGLVQVVSPLPTLEWRTDVRYFDAIVKIAKSPPGLRPGMTAQVEIAMPSRQHVLAVRTEAVASDDGQDVCFVVHEDGLERREVKLGQVTRELTEVTEGLREGERIVLNPKQEEADLDDPADPADVASASGSANTDSPAGEIAASH
jgi:HlyD family secretion protein